MEFRVLGPLEVYDGGSLPLGPAKQRAVLAVLLLHANEVVSTDSLIDALWGERPPETAATALRVYVSDLRKVLGRDLLITRAPGYLLRIAPDESDATRFEELVDRAMLTVDLRRRAALLADALSLWRGAAFADFAYDLFAEAEIARLEERRLAALEERIETELALGARGDLVAELETLAAAHPLRERFVAQLMLALYRAGRQAEALERYRDASHVLLDELGIQPSPALRRLHQAILVQNPSLDPIAGPHAAAGSPALGYKARKPVTVLRVDLSVWSAMADELDPEVSHRLASEYQLEVERVVKGHGGMLKEMSGESAIALFGVPASREDDALRAVRAALELHTETDLDIKVGIETGEVLADTTPTGDPVVVGSALTGAAHLVREAKIGEVVIGARTHRLVAGSVNVAKLDDVEAWRVLDLEVRRRRAVTPFVGRKTELSVLRDALGRTTSTSSCHLCIVVGPPGIGKSRLADQLLNEVGSDAIVGVGRCLSYGEGITYWPLREIVGDFAQGDPREWVSSRLALGESAVAVAERVATAVGAGDSSAQPAETFWAFRKLFEALAQERPVVVVLDDCHWAEPTMLELVDHLVGFSAAAPILILCLARPELFEIRPDWSVPSPARVVIALPPLPEADSRGLAEHLEAARAMSEQARDRAVENAEGNPLFLEQLLAFESEGGNAALPPGIHALLAARIDRLDPGERAVLERAAIEGRVFHRPTVLELLPTEVRPKLDEQLLALIRKDFVEARGADAFRFRHILLRDAAYGATPKEKRAALHEQCAEWLEAGPDVDEIVGYHFEQAAQLRHEIESLPDRAMELAARAADRLASAGRAALSRGDVRGAANFLTRAVALLSARPTDRLQLLPDLADALSQTGQFAEAETVLTEAAKGASTANDETVEWRVRLQRAWLRLEADPNVDVAEVFDEANLSLATFASLQDDRALAHAWHLIAWIEMTSGHVSALTDAVRQGRAHARAAGNALTEEELTVWGLLAGLPGPVPTKELMVEAENEYAQARANGSRRAESAALLVLAVCFAFEGHFADARARLAEATAIDKDLGGGRGSGFQYTPAGMIELLAGNVTAAERELRAGYDSLRERGDAWFLCGVAAELADVLWLQGRDDEALELTIVSENTVGHGVLVAQMMWRGARAKVLARGGQLDEAEALAREAVAIIETTEYVLYRADALTDLAEVLRLMNRNDEAAATAEEARRLYETKGNVAAVRNLDRLLDDLPAAKPLAR